MIPLTEIADMPGAREWLPDQARMIPTIPDRRKAKTSNAWC